MNDAKFAGHNPDCLSFVSKGSPCNCQDLEADPTPAPNYVVKDPSSGDTYYDSELNRMYRWIEGSWVRLYGELGQESGPRQDPEALERENQELLGKVEQLNHELKEAKAGEKRYLEALVRALGVR